MKKILVFHLLLTSIVCFAVWYFVYPHYLWSMEGNSFFSTIPDFTGIQLSLPGDWAKYSSAYLLQFYCFRAMGAGLQAFFVVVILMTSDWMVFRIFRNKGLLWLSFIPAIWFISGQFDDATLIRSVEWSVLFIVLALIVWGVTLRRKKEPGEFRHFLTSHFFTWVVPCLLLGGAVYRLATKEVNLIVERTNYLEYLAEYKHWDKLLQIIPPQEAKRSITEQHFALLALSEKGQLAERFFEYGITDPADFYYERQDYPFYRNFNSQFFLALGLDNEVVHNSFQAGINAPLGMSFRTMRVVIDAWLRMGDYKIAAKGLEIMKHTSCHHKWLQPRLAYLAASEGKSKTDNNGVHPFFIGAHPFLSDMARIVDAKPDNLKALDYLLCGLLIKKDLVKFYYIFDRYYPASSTIPRYYGEALIVLATQYPEILSKYPVDATKSSEFSDFRSLVKGGEMSRQMLELKYGDSFWFHYYGSE